MGTRIYAKLDDEKIKKLDAECEKRNVYRPEIVTQAVEFYLETNGHSRDALEFIKQELEKLREARDAAVAQRNKFKELYERAFQTNEVLIAKIRDLQGQGIFRRAAGLMRIITDTYDISGGSK